MPRMFTETHRNKHFRDRNHPEYHGDVCERIHLEGMEMLKDLKYYQAAIALKRRSSPHRVRRTVESQTWDQLCQSRGERHDIYYLRTMVKATAARLKTLRVAYTEEHSKRHNQPLRFEVKDADGNRVDLFVTYDAANHCKLRSGLGATLNRYEEKEIKWL